jgi:hypothetical protein
MTDRKIVEMKRREIVMFSSESLKMIVVTNLARLLWRTDRPPLSVVAQVLSEAEQLDMLDVNIIL